MATAFIGFGSNLGNRIDFCDRAVTLLGLLPHSRLEAVSSLYETEPLEDGAAPALLVPQRCGTDRNEHRPEESAGNLP